MLYAARTSLLLAVVALGALLVAIVIGGIAGSTGGVVDEALSRFFDFVLVLPAIYVVIALRP